MVSFTCVSRVWCVGALIGSLAMGASGALAQEPISADGLPSSSREEQLREQLKGILQELDDLKRNRESALPPAERPKTVTEKAATPEDAEMVGAIPE